jgi:hypothetical protein
MLQVPLNPVYCSDQYYFILFIFFLPIYLHFLRNNGVDRFAGIVWLDGQFAVKAPVNKYAERHLGRSSEIQQGIQRRPDGPARVQHIVYQDHFFVLDAERNIRGIGDMQAFPHIIPVKRNIQLTIFDQGRVNNGFQFVHDPVAQEYPPGLQADKHRIGEQQVILQYLVRQSFNRQGKLLFGKDRLQTPDF